MLACLFTHGMSALKAHIFNTCQSDQKNPDLKNPNSLHGKMSSLCFIEADHQ